MENPRINLLQSPENIDFSSLEELMEKYPWFSFLHILWLLKYKTERPEEFSSQLKKHIIYIRDRKRLFQILNNNLWDDLIKDPEPTDIKETEIVPDNRDEQEPEEKELLEFSYNKGEDNESDEGGSNSINEENENKGPVEGFSEQVNKPDENNTDKINLIERFLEIDPGPIPADKKSSLEGDVSKKCIEEDESFITDTLARIYIKQGLYSKAIFAYEKLSLKYPEKSIYFASQIEEIKKILSNK